MEIFSLAIVLVFVLITVYALGTVDQFMQMMMIKTARDLQVDPTISPAAK